MNPSLQLQISLILQSRTNSIFQGVIEPTNLYDLVICNPPFHSSQIEANNANERKVSNLKLKKETHSSLNFGGNSNELWCEGGEVQFISNMIQESSHFAKSVLWFSSLVSKKSSLDYIYYQLQKVNAVDVKTIEMGQGNKISRIVAWTFFAKDIQEKWALARWK